MEVYYVPSKLTYMKDQNKLKSLPRIPYEPINTLKDGTKIGSCASVKSLRKERQKKFPAETTTCFVHKSKHLPCANRFYNFKANKTGNRIQLQIDFERGEIC